MTVIDDGIKTKHCPGCKTVKTADEFHKNSHNNDGLANYCKECRKNARLEKAFGTANMKRSDRFMFGHLDPTELTFEELAGGYIIEDDGTKRESATMERRAVGKFQNELNRRLNVFIRDKSARALEVIFQTMDSELVEPETRFKAAQWWTERVMGKTPEVLQMSLQESPHEAIFESIAGGSRQQHRAAIGQAIDAEVVEDDENVDNDVEVEVVSSETVSGEKGDVFNVDAKPSDLGQPITTTVAQPETSESVPGRVVANKATVGRSNKSEVSTESVADEIERKRKEAKALKKRIADAKKKRFAARAVGATSLSHAPWLIDWRVCEDGLLACLVPPAAMTPSRLAIITANASATDDLGFIATQRANQLAKKAEKMKAKAERLKGSISNG